jgi:hypothetical protein
MTPTPDPGQHKRTRGVIIELLYGRHAAQQSRTDHIALWHMLTDLGCDVGENEVITQLEDLLDRGYVTFNQKKNRFTNRTEISVIQLTSKARDLFEETIPADPAVSF